MNRSPENPISQMPHTRRYTRRRGCGAYLLGALVVLVACSFICGTSLLVYVLIPPAPLDILVLGIDARPGEGYVTRTDSIMVVGVQPQALRVNLLSIPRDLFIDVPYYGSERINTINVLGEMEAPGNGPVLLGTAIEQSFGIGVDRYIRLNFQGFVALVDAVGGVDIEVQDRIVDYTYPTEDYGTQQVVFEPGWQHMDGERALIYARTRHADDDYRRAARQQQVVSAVARKLINPIYWAPASATISQYFDTNLSIFDLVTIAPPLILSGGSFDQLVIDREYILPGGGGAVPNYSLLHPWTDERFD